MVLLSMLVLLMVVGGADVDLSKRNLLEDEIKTISTGCSRVDFIIKYWASIPWMVFIRVAMGDIWFSITTCVIPEK